MSNQQIINLITAVYMWFNQISDPAVPFQKADLEKYFTPTFIMDMNDKIITKDYNSLFNHFEKFRKSGSTFNVVIPFKEIVISEDKKKCVVRYNINKKTIDDKFYNIKVIAIWHISPDGRLNRMNEVVYFVEE
jgi:hypothetical protein